MLETVNVMEAIWQTCEKGEDACFHTPLDFIDFLWDHGFVDTETHSKETWRTAFEPFKQADDSYKISHEEFLSLDKYRYTGPIHIPFDATRINEGKYTDEGFDQLARDSIEPSCGLSPPELKLFIDELKKEFRQPDDLILIKANAKQKIKKLLDDIPSPLRRLEILFDQLLSQKGIEEEVEKGAQQLSRVATPEQQALIQQSTFTTGATSFAEVQAKRLKDVTKTTTPKFEEPIPGGEPLKKVKRSKKGIRG